MRTRLALAELTRTELMRTKLALAELVWMKELVQMVVRAGPVRTALVRTGLVRTEGRQAGKAVGW